MKKELRIGIDVDGTLADYPGEVIKFLNKKYKKQYRFSDIMQEDCYNLLGNPFSRAVKLTKFYFYSNRLMNISPVAGSQKAVEKLKQQNKLFIVTSRFSGFSSSSLRWLDNNFGKNTFEKMQFSHILTIYSKKFKARKYLDLDVDFVVEDSPYVAEECSKLGIKVFLLDYPWNKHFNARGVTRIKRWDNLLEKINSATT